MKKFLNTFLIIFLFFLNNACSSLFLQKPINYVKVDGNHLVLDGKNYYFLGTNLWYGCYLGSTGETGDRGRLIKELDYLKSIGITNLRVLASSEKSEIKNSLKPAIQISPGVYNESLLEGLDFLLCEMGKRDMRAVVFLNNYWEWSGGMAQYNSWADNEKVADPEDPEVGWNEFMRRSAAFYTNAKANEMYKDFLYKIITRENTVSGLFYYEDPTIMAWQLSNEPRPWGNAAQVEDYFRWIDSTAKFIHSLDPNHLVTTGNEGTMGSLDSPQYYLDAHKSKYIDYMTFHLWLKNWGWYDSKNYEGTYIQAKTKAINYIKQHIKFAEELNKPITLEEFGIGRDEENYSVLATTEVRDNYFETVFKTVYDSALAGAPIAGTNFWTWGGFGRAKHNDFIWQAGDDFTGDPPQEPQGLNSVFNTDTSTISVIKNYSVLMNALCEKQNLRKKLIKLQNR